MLDAGADGVVLADVAHPATAIAAIERVAHPPDGTRGVGPATPDPAPARHRAPSAAALGLGADREHGGGAPRRADRLGAGARRRWSSAPPTSPSRWARRSTRARPELLHAVETVRRATRAAGVALGVAGALEAMAPRGLRAAPRSSCTPPTRACARAPSTTPRRGCAACSNPTGEPPSHDRVPQARAAGTARRSADVRRTVSEMLARHRARRRRRDPPLLARARRLGPASRSSSTTPTIAARRRAARRRAARPHRLRPGAGARLRAGAARRPCTTSRSRRCPASSLGHRHIPVQHRRLLRPRRALPDDRLVAHDRRRRRRSPASSASSPARRRSARAGIHPAMLYAMATSGADDILALGGVQALAAMAFGIEGLAPADMIVGAGQRLRRRGQAPAVRPRRHRPARRADRDRDDRRRDRRPELVAADLLGQAEHGPTSPAVLITTSRALGAGGARARSTRCCATWPTARGRRAPRGETHGSVVVVERRRGGDRALRRDRARAPRGPGRRGPARAATARGLRNYGSLFLGAEATVAYGDKAVGTNHVLPTMRRRALHRRPVGRQVPEDLHLPAADRGGHAARSRPPWRRSRTPSASQGHALTATMRLDRSGVAIGREDAAPDVPPGWQASWSPAPAAASAPRMRAGAARRPGPSAVVAAGPQRATTLAAGRRRVERSARARRRAATSPTRRVDPRRVRSLSRASMCSSTCAGANQPEPLARRARRDLRPARRAQRPRRVLRRAGRRRASMPGRGRAAPSS